MMMHELMEQLHGVEAGAFDFERELAGEAAGAIEILQTKLNRYEELKQKGLLLVIPELDVREGCSMDFEKMLHALKRMKVETGSLLCAGCGHEHSCGTRGCAILRNAVLYMEVLMAHYDHLNKLLDEKEEELCRFRTTFNERSLTKLAAEAFGMTLEQLQKAVQSFQIKEEKVGEC